jgi:hypothetical protein
MKLPHAIVLPALAVACLAAMPAHAVTQGRTASTPAAHLCTLSIPTTDTKVRPKATGFRNEGTTTAFVICAFDSAPGQAGVYPFEMPSDPTLVGLLFSSIDGASHSFTCTGVNSFPGGSIAAPMQYVAKTVTINPATDPGPLVEVDWKKNDFGGTNAIPTSGNFSVTCQLPPGAAILFGAVVGSEDVGT